SAAFFDDLKTRLRTNASIASVATVLFQTGMLGKLTIDGEPRQFTTDVWFIPVDEEYFRTMRVRLMSGRDFTAGDRRGAPPVALARESLARQVAGGGEAVD